MLLITCSGRKRSGVDANAHDMRDSFGNTVTGVHIPFVLCEEDIDLIKSSITARTAQAEVTGIRCMLSASVLKSLRNG